MARPFQDAAETLEATIEDEDLNGQTKAVEDRETLQRCLMTASAISDHGSRFCEVL